MLGISPGELLAVRTTGTALKPRTVAEYSYETVLGTVLAVKVRREPKSFRWRLPSGAYRLAGVTLPIFNQPALVDMRRVFVTEGEKGVQRLARLNLPATCPPAGASCWKPEWTSQVWRLGALEAIILADHDAAGEHHAEAVATALHGYTEVPTLPDDAEAPWASWPMAEVDDADLAPLRVKVVRLPNLPPSGDVVDWLDGGHSRADLLALVNSTPFWTPDLRASQRMDRRRDLTRNRMRRLRARRAESQSDVTQVLSEERSVSCNTDYRRHASHDPESGPQP
jgi:hypothetical protein